MRWQLRTHLIALILLFSFVAEAQQAREVFGRNRIQYKKFEWQYISSENFDVYYYDNRRAVATEAIQYLESEFDRITDLIGYPPYLKTKIFLFNSVTDKQQSNTGLSQTMFNSGGETEFIQPYVEIAHPGNVDEFKQELIYKMSQLMVNEMMFGGSLKDMFQNAVLLNLPEWFIEGASLYAAKGWSSEMDDFARQMVVSRKLNRALRLKGPEAALVGQSVWNYIVEKYGKSSVSNILNYTRVIRNEQKSILITLGIPFRQLIADWKQFYLTQQQRVNESYVSPPDTRLTARHNKTTIYPTVKISPDGKKIAFAENDRGKFYIKVRSLESGRESTILSGGNKVIKQDVDFRIPLISWADANTLGVIGVKQGAYIFWLYDLNTKSKLPRELENFSNVRSFDFSGNGRLIVMSADFEGQNDLFLLSSRRDRTRRLTNDIYDDLDPTFIPNTNQIVFSSNRTNDTTNTQAKGYKNLSANYNLFLYNLDSANNIANRLTNTVSKDVRPIARDEDNFYYLSDQRGITNLFKFTRSTGIYSQVTNFNSSIEEYDVNFYDRSLAVVLDKDLSTDIFLINNFNYDRSVFTPTTRRKEVQMARAITEKRKTDENAGMTIKELLNSRLRAKSDTITIDTRKEEKQQPPPTIKEMLSDSVKTDLFQFEDETPETKPDTVTLPTEKPAEKPAEKTIDTDDYVFEDEAVKSKQPGETFLTRYMKARETNKVMGPFPYEPKFNYNNLVTNLVIDPIRSYSLRIETQMNDMLENYRFYGGLQTAFDWKSGDVYGELQYLPQRVDFSARFDRKVIFWDQRDLTNTSSGAKYFQKYSWQKIEVGASLPLSVRTRVTLKPFAGFTRYMDRGPNSVPSTPPEYLPTQQQFYAGTKAEFVYDNSISTGMNLIEGTRAKLTFTHYEGIANKNASFSNIAADVRHYQKIYKEIVLAVRGFAGSFFGRSAKLYALGGVDNWFGQTRDSSTPGHINYEGIGNPFASVSGKYNQNLIFTEFATNLRGFDYSTLYGENVVLANVEFRVPLIRALAGGPITSNFFRNMQFIGFYDVGTSWRTGGPPFTDTGSVRQREVVGGPFSVQLNEYLNPWLYSYGVGMRSVMLGYYMKIDVAWPVENYHTSPPRWMVTLGHDF
jgi:Tol biopolymer transport system component